VVKSIDAGESMQIPGTVLGYAQFPYNIFPSGLMSTDGVVLRSDHTGRIGTAMQPGRSGRTATHEVGHWLGLRHIWMHSVETTLWMTPQLPTVRTLVCAGISTPTMLQGLKTVTAQPWIPLVKCL